MGVVYSGFTEGRNHPDDVEGMAWLFRRFGHTRHISKAIAIWTDGDALIAQLRAVADRLHEEIAAGAPDPEAVTKFLEEIHTLNERLTVLEDEFSQTLGLGNRWITRVLGWT